ncbi:MAG: hypothetical protein HKN32_05795 [Flavobacteriales bacterium]|nr:hypothetical protein [Flavobacteriales bacterium]
MRPLRVILFAATLLFSFGTLAQSPEGIVSGNVQVLWQKYNEDSLIGAEVPPELAGFNAFGNINYSKGNFTAGIRYESYLSPVLGYPGRFNGTGIGYRYAQYTLKNLDVTIGNFYDQFGSGMIFRAYEERNLGLDNAMDGFRVVWNPMNGVYLKGIYGKQRFDFDSRLINGPGIVRGFDGEIYLNDTFEKLAEKKTKVTLGGSFISRYQPGDLVEKSGEVLIDGQAVDTTLFLLLPKNVGAGAARINVLHGGFNFYGEYVRKINDPNADNANTYNTGEGILLQAAYSQRGFGVSTVYKAVDNMSFRSDRNQLLFDVPINFIPAITKQHTYNLAATLYPYATQVNGEVSYSAEVFYKFKKNTPLGGKYGTNISVNYATAFTPDTTRYSSSVDELVYGYERNSFGIGNEVLVKDLNIEIKKKINKKLKLSYTYFNMVFNTVRSQVTTDFKGQVYADIHVLEANYKIKPKHSVRVEAQTMLTNQDKKDWATALVEYNWSPHWFFSVIDQYNFGNDDVDQRVHYLFGTVGYINGANRISFGYGKRRAGVFCVGGVCRVVPASNGMEITITSSF